MKTKVTSRLALAVLLAASAYFAEAQTPDRTITTFDSGTQGEQPDGCGFWYGSGTAGWDASQDATGNGGGSLYVQTTWGGSDTPLTEYICLPGNNLWWSGAGTYNLSEYKSIQFDIKWDSSATVTVDQWNDPSTFPNGSLAGSDLGLVVYAADGSGGVTAIVSTNIPALAASGWVHMTIPVDSAQSGIDPSVGIMLKKWLNNNSSITGTNESGVYTNTANFWIDNVMLEGTAAPPPPPTTSLSDASPGLNIITTGPGQYDRHSIRTIQTGYTFYDSATPTTYSYTIRDMPGSENADFQTHVFLVPNAPAASTSAPDWNSADVIWLNLQVGEGGTNTLSFLYKTNLPNGNSMYFNEEATNGPVGNLGALTTMASTGTFGMTFENNTNVTIFTPTSSTNVILPPGSAAMFSGPLNVYVGTQPNQIANKGLATVLSEISITGAASAADIVDSFSPPPLNTNVWEISSADASGIVVLPDDSKYWLEWTLPDGGFSPQGSASVSGGSWSGLTSDILNGHVGHKALVTSGDLPGADEGYWRLIKRSFTKLLVLLPGETNAPGTATGKIGTPDPVSISAGGGYGIVDVTILGVDDEFNVVSSASGIINLTSDAGLNGIMPNDDSMIGGSLVQEAAFLTEGTYIITATNLSSETMPAATSSSFQVVP